MMYFSFMVGMDTTVLALAPWEFLPTAHGNSTFLLTLAFSRSVSNDKEKSNFSKNFAKAKITW